MSTFSCPGVTVSKVEGHPNADRLDLVSLEGMDFTLVRQKGIDFVGAQRIYVPEGALVPENILKCGFWDEDKGKGILAGSKGDRVKAVRLRGSLSQGLLLDPDRLPLDGLSAAEIVSGEDYAALLGIVKYEPPIPTHMSGQLERVPFDMRSFTEVENLRRYPDVLKDGEPVVITEKIHGTCAIYALHGDGAGNYHFAVASKGIAHNGTSLVESETNVYWRMAREHDLEQKLRFLHDYEFGHGRAGTLFLFGEVFGPVQDLKYGGKLQFRAFDLAEEHHTPKGHPLFYLNWPDFAMRMGWEEIPIVPTLYRGPYSRAVVDEYTDGQTLVIADATHIREGVVVRPVYERYDDRIGRVLLKSVSVDYLTRKGEQTEYV